MVAPMERTKNSIVFLDKARKSDAAKSIRIV